MFISSLLILSALLKLAKYRCTNSQYIWTHFLILAEIYVSILEYYDRASADMASANPPSQSSAWGGFLKKAMEGVEQQLDRVLEAPPKGTKFN